MTKLIPAPQVCEILRQTYGIKLSPKNIWVAMRRRGIKIKNLSGKGYVTRDDVDLFALRYASGERVNRSFTGSDGPVPEEQVRRNRALLQAQIEATMRGYIKPRYLDAAGREVRR